VNFAANIRTLRNLGGNMQFKKKWVISAVVGLVLVGGGLFAFKDKLGGSAQAKPEPPAALQFTPQEIATVQRKNMLVELQASGVLMAERSATVRAKAAAVVNSITVREGDTVKAGQVIAQLDAAELLQKVASQEGLLAAAQARLVAAKKTRDQQLTLFNQQYISQTALDGAQSGFDAAGGDAKAAQAQLMLARQALGDAIVRAPLAGVVAKRFVQPGEKLNFDAPLVQIVDLSALELQSWVAPEALSQLKVGSAVKVRVAGVEAPITAQIKRVLPVADLATRQIGVVINVPNESQLLKSGLQATASIVLANHTALIVPASAVADNAGVTSLCITKGKEGNSQSTALGERNVTKVAVATGLRDDASGIIEIIAPQIKEGDVVLSGRYDGLKDGQTVKLVQAVSQTPKAAASEATTTAKR
jgi:membrane fusion protein, multidrug efflux system